MGVDWYEFAQKFMLAFRGREGKRKPLGSVPAVRFIREGHRKKLVFKENWCH